MGYFEPGHPLRWLADHLFESYDGQLGHERAYWRAYGFILAFPLNVYNVFTDQPMWLWLDLFSPNLCPYSVDHLSAGVKALIAAGYVPVARSLAETMGDSYRSKMPHGPIWNRVNMLGQVVLSLCLCHSRFADRPAGPWVKSHGPPQWCRKLFEGLPFLSYGWSVDIFLAGILGVGFVFLV